MEKPTSVGRLRSGLRRLCHLADGHSNPVRHVDFDVHDIETVTTSGTSTVLDGAATEKATVAEPRMVLPALS